MAYTYLIGWSEHRKYYYGVRFAKNAQPEDLWISYFTSSKHVKKFAKEHGTPDIIEIRKIFDDVQEARNWEHKVLRRLKVKNNDIWLNKTDNISMPNFSPIWTKESREKASLSSKKAWTEDRKEKASIRLTECNPARLLETKRKISKKLAGRDAFWMKGIKRPEHSALMTGSNNPRAVSFEYEGKHYGTIKSFMEEHGVSFTAAKKIINSNDNIRIK